MLASCLFIFAKTKAQEPIKLVADILILLNLYCERIKNVISQELEYYINMVKEVKYIFGDNTHPYIQGNNKEVKMTYKPDWLFYDI